MKEVYRISLTSKNNTKTKKYIYSIVVKCDGVYYYAGFVTTHKPIKKQDVDVNTLELKREIPFEFYKANGITN